MEVELTPDIERRAYNYCTADALQYFKAYCWVYHNRLTEDKIARFGKNRKDSKFIEREWFELQADLYLNRDDRYDSYVSANPWGQNISRRIISTPIDGQNKR